jgi:hypothetical protein
MDPHHFDNLDPHPDPHPLEKKNLDPDPHQSDKLDLEQDSDPHQFADDMPKFMKYEPI